ncbi:MFS transporter, partial [Dehalococcoides mccartyi]|nr:MFS transporter [Dehalococcoides mccartyi]
MTMEPNERGERKLLAAVALGAILAPLNSTMIAVALPGIVDDFNASVASATWLVTAYLVVMASVQPLAGKIGDTMGRRKLIIASLILFLGVSIGAAFAPNIWILLAFRVGQAFTISIVLSNSFAILRQVIPASRRGRTFGMVEAATGLSAAAGPLVGGLLVTLADWRAIFLVNIPFVVLGIILAWQSIPHDSKSGAWKGFDYKGAILLPTTLLTLAVFFLMLSRGVVPALYIPVGIGLIVSIVLLLKLELAHPNPVFQPRFFKKRGFAAPSVSVGTSNLSMYSLLLVIPLMLTARGGFSEFEIGLVLTSLSVGMAFLTPIGGRMADKLGRRKPVVIGLTITTIGTLPFAFAGASIPMAPLILGLGLIGIGIGISGPAGRTSAVESIPAKDAGSGAGVYSTSRYIGSIVGA